MYYFSFNQTYYQVDFEHDLSIFLLAVEIVLEVVQDVQLVLLFHQPKPELVVAVE